LVRVWTNLHRHPVWTGASTFAALLIVVALVWNWNWFRPMVEKKIADELQRPVTLQRFDVEHALSAQPTLVLDGIAIGNPPNFPDGTQTGTIDELRVSFDLRALVGSFGKKIIVSELIVQHPEGDLRPGPQGNPNWTFPMAEDSSGNAAPPRIGSLVITDGDFRFADRGSKPI
jgi:AsmA family protein